MKEYQLTVMRTIRVLGTIYVEGDSAEDAEARFQHQLESRECSGIEDEIMWGEANYYQVCKADPYDFEYEVVNAEEAA